MNSVLNNKVNLTKKVGLKFVKWFFFGIVLFILYFPIIFIIDQSVNADGTGVNFGGFTLKWFSELFKDKEFVAAIWNTISIAIMATAITGAGTPLL